MMHRIGLAVALIMMAVPVAAQSNDLPPVDANEQREIAQQILTELGYQNGTFDSPANGASDASSTPSDSRANSNTSGQSTSDSSEQATTGGSADNDNNTNDASSSPPPVQTPPPAQSPDGKTASAGARVLQILGIAVVIVALGALIWHLVGQRVAEAERAPKRTKALTRPDRPKPKTLEQTADSAAEAGDYERAIRLRFQAGLIRLETQGVLEYQETLTTGHVAGLLESDRFDGIAESFDAVAYGARAASVDDYQHAAQTWPIVISEAGKR